MKTMVLRPLRDVREAVPTPSIQRKSIISSHIVPTRFEVKFVEIMTF